MSQPTLTTLSHHLFVYRGAVNVGVIHRGEEALLIDSGDGSVMDELQRCGIRFVDGVLFTHHHRDQACGAYRALDAGAWTGAPEAERSLFEDVRGYWHDHRNRWHVYHSQPQLVLTEPVPVHRTFVDGDTLKWSPARITALSTPGHTDGSMTYLVDVDGQRIAFCGDLIYDDGQILNLYSLQKGDPNLLDYHGFMGAYPSLLASLRRILSAGATVLVPSHGAVIRNPQTAVERLEAALNSLYERWADISALRYYFPHRFRSEPLRNPMLSHVPTPSCLRHLDTSWMLFSDSGHLLVADCGSERVIEQVEQWLAQGCIRRVDALWITHYHDDHVEWIPEFRDRFGCEVIAEQSVAQVVTNPAAWRLPCQSPKPVPVDRVVQDGESWQWHEFLLTAFHFPGQSLYHSGLMVDGQAVRVFLCGDSFTPTGLDNYCPFNRNLLDDNSGYFRCLRLLKELQPELLCNAHVDAPFACEVDVLEGWESSLKEQVRILASLSPSGEPDDLLDPNWAYCFPYEQRVAAGEEVSVDMVVRNPSDGSRFVLGVPVLPREWNLPQIPAQTALVPARQEVRLPFRFRLPSDTPAGTWVVPVNVELGERFFLQFPELMLYVR